MLDSIDGWLGSLFTLMLYDYIIYVIRIVSQFIHAPRQPYWEAISHILRYLTGVHGKNLLYNYHKSSWWRASVMLFGHVVTIL